LEYQLSDDRNYFRRGNRKYYSGEEPSFTWEEVKINARKSFNERNLKFTFRAKIDIIVAYEFYESRTIF